MTTDRERIAGAIALGIRDGEHPRIITDTVLELIQPNLGATSPGVTIGCALCDWAATGVTDPMALLDAHLRADHPDDPLTPLRPAREDLRP